MPDILWRDALNRGQWSPVLSEDVRMRAYGTSMVSREMPRPRHADSTRVKIFPSDVGKALEAPPWARRQADLFSAIRTAYGLLRGRGGPCAPRQIFALFAKISLFLSRAPHHAGFSL